MKDQRYPTVDEWIALHGDEPDIVDPDAPPGSHLISVDELRAAGALDVPPAWRKSLGGEERRFLLPGFNDDEEAEPQSAEESDSDDDGSAADRS